MSYTVKNLRAVADQAPSFGLSEIAEARFPREELQSESVGLAYHVLRPNKRHGFAHRHKQAEEIYVVLSGGGRMKLDDEYIDLAPMDAIRVSPAVLRAFEAGPLGLELLVFGPHHAGDGELVHGDHWGEAASA
ncbi:MAG: cupin domain-containing protein [Solirubrobacteraceae bacterium]